MASLNLFRGGRKSERGAELIEFALVLPLLLLIVLGIVDFGFLFQRLEVVTNAAREGARLAVLPEYNSTDVTNRVQDYLEEGGVGRDATNVNPHVEVTGPTDIPITGGGTYKGMQVTVRYFHQYLFLSGIAGFFGGSFSSVPLNGTSVMRCEAGCGP
jgi:Flp pilus assembly protein TadG